MNKIYLIDCMDFMKDKPDNFYDLAIVDPPYGIGDFNPPNSLNKYGERVKRNSLKVDWNDTIPNKNYFNEVKRISKNQIIWGANYYNCFTKGGAIIWHKGKINPILSQCEIASLSFQQKVDYVLIQWQSGFARKQYEKDYNAIHPSQKPVALYKWILKNYAKPGYKLLDTHSGSGSFRIAAYDMGFDLDSCELDKDYFAANEKRFQDHIQQNDLFKKSEYQDLLYKD
ncbi:hypothetical protein LCGC14_1031880 [marine sediment metagenome]|uniref:DNA methylase N-4/N-6 domain-containing protein n=1 Tax=marine sediment metagenome TaxID=412755 RepID=A0A0F9R0B6_9ZZZZ